MIGNYTRLLSGPAFLGPSIVFGCTGDVLMTFETFKEYDAARPNTVRRVPSQATIEDWIAQAKKLPKVVEH